MSWMKKWEKRIDRVEDAGALAEISQGNFPALNVYKRATNAAIKWGAPNANDPGLKRVMRGRNIFLGIMGIAATGFMMYQHSKHKDKKH